MGSAGANRNRVAGKSNFNSADGVTNFLQGELDTFGFGISKERLAEQVYRAAKTEGADVAVLNSKYITIKNNNGEAEFSFTKSKKDNKWKLTPMFSYSDITTGRHNGVTMYRAAGQWFAQKSEAEKAALKKLLG